MRLALSAGMKRPPNPQCEACGKPSGHDACVRGGGAYPCSTYMTDGVLVANGVDKDVDCEWEVSAAGICTMYCATPCSKGYEGEERCSKCFAPAGTLVSEATDDYMARFCRDPSQDCGKRFFRFQGMCKECPNNAWLLVLAFCVGAAAVGILGYVLNKRDVNLAGLNVGIDFFQCSPRRLYTALLAPLTHNPSALCKLSELPPYG